MEYPSLGTPPAGSIRFNTDSSKMEIYNGDKWWEIDSTSPESRTGGARGVSTAGNTPTYYNEIVYWNIDTTGNATDFGDATKVDSDNAGLASSTRGVVAGGYATNVIEYITILS